jgi:hypothetical protein
MEGEEKSHTDKYREIMHDWNCDCSCTLTPFPVWHIVIKIIYANTRLIGIIINSLLPLLSPHTFDGNEGVVSSPQNSSLLYPGTQHLIV